MTEARYLVIGDIHGRILPAFRLARAWSRESGVELSGICQVGDLGFFPDHARLDKATRQHAADDPMELGVALVTEPSPEADREFLQDDSIRAKMYATAGNHEDHDALRALEARAPKDAGDFAADAYGRLRMIIDGGVATLAGGLRVGAIWGIDREATGARKNAPDASRIVARNAAKLESEKFDVLLTHDGPRDSVKAGVGSEAIHYVILAAQPAFAFFGHYGSHTPRRIEEGDFGRTQVYLMGDFEFGGSGGSADEGCAGVLTWTDGKGTFEYLDPRWLKSFTRNNWSHH